MELLTANFAPIMFAGLICFLLFGFPVAFSLGACGLFFAFVGIELGLLPEALMQALPLRLYRHHAERHAARDPVFHADGADPRTQRHGRGLARDDRPAVRLAARRARVGRRVRRRAACSHHRRGRSFGDLDGPDLAADHDALRLRPAACDRRDRRQRHARADHPAVARADHPGRPARPQRRRHVTRARSCPASC